MLELCSNPLEKTEDADYDEDGLSNLAEMQEETNPYLPDTDLDGISDKEDAEPQKTDVNSKKEAGCDFYIPTGYYDKKLCGYDEEGEYYEYIYNTLLDVYRYCQTGDDNKVYNFYDASGNQIGSVATSGGKNVINTYQYDKNGNITYITHNGFAYDFSYDENGNLTNAKVGGQQLISVDYKENTDSVQKVKYGNGDTKEYIYEETGLLATKVKVNGKTAYEYKYDGDGNLQEEKNCENRVVYSYEYTNGELEKVISNQGFTIVKEIGDDNKTRKISYEIKGDKRTKSIVDNNEDKKVSTKLLLGGKINSTTTNNSKKEIIYNDTGKEILSTDIIVNEKKEVLEKHQDGTNYTYRYDKNGNITEIYENKKLICSYEYDSFNQLVRENNKASSQTTMYAYNKGGNILYCKKYKYTLDSVETKDCIEQDIYEYQEDGWQDILIAVNGEKINCDSIGNPLEYKNNFNSTWKNGRELASLEKEGCKIEYFYNSQGIRTQKIVNGISTEYYLDGSKIVGEVTGENVVWYSYDNNDDLVGFEKDGESYYYKKNMLKDIIGIYNKNGEEIVSYSYDAWGNILSIDGDKELGKANPFRYRSYYYDEESDFYYLQSRYYDSSTKRFLNADCHFDIQANIRWTNLFCYCANNPIMFSDPTGEDVVITIMFTIAIIVYLYIVYTLPRFLYHWRNNSTNLSYGLQCALNTISGYSSAAASVVYSKAKTLADAIGESFAQALAKPKPSYNSTHELHHIVAQNAQRAKPARDILQDLGIDVENDSDNLILIQTGLHKQLHRVLYYEFVNKVIIAANNAGGTSRVKREKNVRRALKFIRAMISGLNANAPF